MITNDNNAGKKMLLSSVQEMVSYQNIEVLKKSPTTLIKITNESTQHISSTKQSPVIKCSSKDINKLFFFDNAGKKMLFSSKQGKLSFSNNMFQKNQKHFLIKIINEFTQNISIMNQIPELKCTSEVPNKNFSVKKNHLL